MPVAQVQVRDLRKAYGGRDVLSGVDLTIAAGSVHALLGPNGSGKSTLIRCLSGAIRPDAGHITIGGQTFDSLTPRAALEWGTAVIYQHFSLIPTLSVADNLFLGCERRRGVRIDVHEQRRASAEILEELGADIIPTAIVGELAIGEQQLVEIAKAIQTRPRLLILDEPTSALSAREAALLGKNLGRLRDQGIAILYVTHLLGEVFTIGDEVTVLRDGSVALQAPVTEVRPDTVIEAISPPRTGGATSPSQLEVTHASTEPSRRPAEARVVLDLEQWEAHGIGPLSLQIRRGQILGVFGLLGSGRTELLEGLYGVGATAPSGHATLHAVPYAPTGPRAALRRGVGLVPGDRARQSLFGSLTALDNMLLPHLRAYSHRYLRRRSAESKAFRAVAGRLNVTPVDEAPLGSTFSGGNQQKLVVGRWVAPPAAVDLLLLDEPTQGIDVGARQELYDLVRELARVEDRAIVFTTSDPQELLELADRALVLAHGRSVWSGETADLDEQQLLHLAHAISDGDKASP